MNYLDAIEKLSIYFSSDSYEKEVLAAKADFFGDVGVDDKESDRYEQWMNMFFDWYLFSCPLPGTSLPPAKYALEIDEFQSLESEEKAIFQDLAKTEHALLEFIKVRGDIVWFKDILRRRKIQVAHSDLLTALEKGDICDARVVPSGDIYLMTKGFCLHPAETRRFILKEAKALKKAGEEEFEKLQVDLVRMFFKLQQYGHLRHDQIYTRDSKIRF